MKLSDLAESARSQVAAGLPAGTLEQADAQLRRLSTESLLPLCPLARAQSPEPESGAGTSAPEAPGEPPMSPSPTPAAPTVTTLPAAAPAGNRLPDAGMSLVRIGVSVTGPLHTPVPTICPQLQINLVK
jgi:protein phosphatase